MRGRIILISILALTFASDALSQENGFSDPSMDTVGTTEKAPQFPGGMVALYKYIAENRVYPEEAKKYMNSGKIYVHFVVDSTGKVIDPVIIKGLDHHLNEEALRLVREMPDWQPGESNNKKINVNYSIPIAFYPPKTK